MERDGFTAKAIAQRLRVNERTVKDYKTANRREPLPDPTGRDVLRANEKFGPVPFEELDPEVRWCLEDSPEGFRRFNDRFWPHEPMPAHILSFARAAYSYIGTCERRIDEHASDLGRPDRPGDAAGPSDGSVVLHDRHSVGGLGRPMAHQRRLCGAPAAYRSRHGLLCNDCVLGYRVLGGQAELEGAWKTRVVLNVPPGHGKTTYFTVRMSSWRLCQNRSWRIIVISETDVIARTMVGDIAGELEDPEGLAATFGPFRSETQWGPGHGRIRVLGSKAAMKDASVFGRGVTTQINGLRADEIMCDDLVSRDSCKTPERRRDAEEGYTSTIVSRLVPGGIVRVIGTRWHMEDLYAALTTKKRTRLRSEDPVYEHVNFPAVLDWDAKLSLWPDYWSFDRLMSEKFDEMSGMGSTMFNLVYQQEPAPPGSTLVSYASIYGSDDDPDPNRGCLDRDRRWGYQPPREGYVRLISIDPSPTMYWGIVVMDMLEAVSSDVPYVVDVLEVVRAKLDVRSAMVHLRRMLRTYSPRYVVAEINSWRGWLRDDLEWRELEREFGVLVRPHTTTQQNKDHQLYGLDSLGGDFELRRIRLPYSGVDSVGQSAYVIEEALNYPFYPTWDVLMAIWFPKAQRLALRNPRRLTQRRSGSWPVPPRLAKRRWTAENDARPEFLVPAGQTVTLPIGSDLA